MSRRSQRNTYLRHIAMLITIPLVLMGTGYALFSQQLAINTTLAKPSYSSSQNIYMRYTKTVTAQSSVWLYSLSPITVTNSGVTSVTAWQIRFDVPAGSSTVTCPTTVSCSRSGNTVTINNGTGNATIAAGASRTFNISFTAPVNNAILQNIVTTGTYSTAFQAISGLTVNAAQGTRTRQGNTYYYPYVFTVTNNTGQSLSAWQIVTSWSTANSNAVNSMDASVSYTTTSTNLTMTRTATIADGETFTYNARFQSRATSWNFSSIVIRGRA